jgi:hypothetical protein
VVRLARSSLDLVEAPVGGWSDARVMVERPLPMAWEEQRIHTGA